MKRLRRWWLAQRWRYLPRLWYWRMCSLPEMGKWVNRRAEVEGVLLNVASGKRPILTREECRALARKLGTLE